MSILRHSIYLLWIAQYLSSAPGVLEYGRTIHTVCAHDADLAFENNAKPFYMYYWCNTLWMCSQGISALCVSTDQIRIGVLCRIRGIDGKVILKSILDFSNTRSTRDERNKQEQQQLRQKLELCLWWSALFRNPLLLTDFNILSNIVLHYNFPFTMGPMFQYAHWNANFFFSFFSFVDWIVWRSARNVAHFVHSQAAIAKHNPIDMTAWEFIKTKLKIFLPTNNIGFFALLFTYSFSFYSPLPTFTKLKSVEETHFS